eukprot:90740-Prymnesium_polylepis.1
MDIWQVRAISLHTEVWERGAGEAESMMCDVSLCGADNSTRLDCLNHPQATHHNCRRRRGRGVALAGECTGVTSTARPARSRCEQAGGQVPP